MRPAKDQTKHFLCIPSTNRWTKRENQPVPRTIFATLLREPTERMGILATLGAIHPKLLAKCINKEIPIRTYFRIRTPGPSTIKRSKYPRHQRPTSTHQKSKRRSPTCTETNPGKDDQGDKVQRLRNWKQSMVGRNEHQKTLRQQETIPKAIRTFRGSRQDFPRRLSDQSP